MSTLLFVLSRYVAPFASGLFMAAATAVDDPMAVVCLVGFAGVFAFFSFEVGSRMIDGSLRTKLNSLKIAMKEVG